MKKQLLTTLGGVMLSGVLFSASAQVIPAAPTINAKGYILMDFHTKKVIAEGNSDMQLAPASLTKMMTSYVIGVEMKKGALKATDMVNISENAWSKNYPDSSKMFIEVGTQVSVAELNKGIIIQSGNDACVAMAEHIAGTESAFADIMNAHAQTLGMSGTHFVNSHGLPDPDHYTTPRDMATLGIALIRDVPEEYAIYSEKSFVFNGITQYNRNSLLYDKSMNVDGIKTGHTSEAGYSLVSSATKGEMRLVAVVMGTDSERARKDESKTLLNYGFRYFETLTAYKAGESFADQRIWMGDKETVKLGIADDIAITIPRGQRKNLKADFKLEQQLIAPIAKGSQVGTVQIMLEEEVVGSYPLVTLEDINEGGFFSRMVDYLKLQLEN